jgi:hypothetical protein
MHRFLDRTHKSADETSNDGWWLGIGIATLAVVVILVGFAFSAF